MSIPDYQSVMLPLLILLRDGKGMKFREIVEALADKFELTIEERKQMLPSGQQCVFDNRVGWARTYLKQAGLIEYPQRGINKITTRGLTVLSNKPLQINVKFLEQFKEFQDFKNRKKTKVFNKKKDILDHSERTPEETLESAYESLRSDLAGEILEMIKSNPPSLFEKIVVELLVMRWTPSFGLFFDGAKL